MTRRAVRSWLGFLFVAALPLAACGGAQAGAQPDKVAEANASPGAGVYRRACAGCHGQDGEGIGSAPAVMSAGALPQAPPAGSKNRGEFKTAADLYQYVSKEMPLPKAKAGSLSSEDYWAVVNYMLKGHGSKIPEGGVNESNAASVEIKPAG